MTATKLSGEATVRRSSRKREAMRFFNIVANRFFSDAFSFVIGQCFEDRLCGTKMLSWSHYEGWVAGREFFGDVDLMFGAPGIRLRLFPQLQGRYLQAVPGAELSIENRN